MFDWLRGAKTIILSILSIEHIKFFYFILFFNNWISNFFVVSLLAINRDSNAPNLHQSMH